MWNTGQENGEAVLTAKLRSNMDGKNPREWISVVVVPYLQDTFAVAVSLSTGKIVYISDQAASILNCKRDVFNNSKFVEFLIPQDVSMFYSFTTPYRLPSWSMCTGAGRSHVFMTWLSGGTGGLELLLWQWQLNRFHSWRQHFIHKHKLFECDAWMRLSSRFLIPTNWFTFFFIINSFVNWLIV